MLKLYFFKILRRKTFIPIFLESWWDELAEADDGYQSKQKNIRTEASFCRATKRNHTNYKIACKYSCL